MNSPKVTKLAAFYKSADSVDDEDTKRKLLLASFGTGALGYKLNQDTQNIQKKLEQFGSAPSATWSKLRSDTSETGQWRAAQGVLDEYISTGRNLATEPIFGVNSGNLLKHLRTKVEIPTQAGQARMEQLFGKKDPEKLKATLQELRNQRDGMIHHYDVFSDNNVPMSEAYDHMVKAHMNRGATDYFHNSLTNNPEVTEEMQNIILNSGKTLPERMQDLKALPKSEAAQKIFKEIVLGGIKEVEEHPDFIGMAKSLGGDTYRSPTSQLYRRRLDPILNKAKLLGRAGIAGGLGLAGFAMTSPKKEKRSAENRPEEETKKELLTRITGAGALGLGAAGLSPAISKFRDTVKNPNLRVGFTYGTMPAVGSGHKEPSAAIKKVLLRELEKHKKDPLLSRVTVTDFPRGGVGGELVNPDAQELNTLVNTGIGIHEPDSFLSRSRYEAEYPTSVKAQSVYNYLTDHPTGKMMGNTGDKGNAHGEAVPLLWGSKNKELFDTSSSFYRKGVHVGGITPAIEPDVLDMIKKTPDKASIKKYIVDSLAKNSEKYQPNDRASIEYILDNIDKKKLLTVSGSGRGDYVVGRAKAYSEGLANTAKTNPEILDKVMLLGQLGSSDKYLSSIRPALEGLSSSGVPVKATGFLPKDVFVQLQRLADVHAGGTGTSSLAESLIGGNPLAIPRNWDKFRKLNDEQLHSKGVFDEHGRLPNAIKQNMQLHPDLNAWNRGNINWALGLPEAGHAGAGGTMDAEHVDQLLNTLLDDTEGARVKTQAQQRGSEFIKELETSQSNIAKDMLARIKKNVWKQRAGGLAKLMLPVGLAGVGGNMLFSSHQKEKKRRKQNTKS